MVGEAEWMSDRSIRASCRADAGKFLVALRRANRRLLRLWFRVLILDVADGRYGTPIVVKADNAPSS